MNWHAPVDPVFSARLCLTLVHSLWQVAVLAMIVFLLGRRRSVELRYVLHVAALFVAVGAIPLTYTIVDVSYPPQSTISRSAVDESRQGALPPGSTTRASTDNARSIVPSTSGTNLPGRAGDGTMQAGTSVRFDGPSNAPPSQPLWTAFMPWIAVFYAAGVVMMLARLTMGIWSAKRLVSQSREMKEGTLAARFQALVERCSVPIRPVLAWTEQIAVPQVVGLLRPTILLPSSALAGLSPDQLEMVLAHELAHLRRFDMWITLLQRVAEAVLFFNPGLWYLSRRISTLREYCCDEWACRLMETGQSEPRTRYATALLRVAELSQAAAGPGSNRRSADAAKVATLAAAGGSPSELRRRVARLFGEPMREPLRLSRASLLIVAGTAGLLLAGPMIWNSAAEPTSPVPASAKPDETAETAPATNNASQLPSAKTLAEREKALRVPLPIVVARHVLLFDGKEVITWQDLSKTIATLPDPSLAHPRLYVTRGAREAGLEEAAKEKIRDLNRKFRFQQISYGSLWLRSDLRYDRIESSDDLKPDESLRIDGTVVDQTGAVVAGAEILLITQVDESIPYRSYHVALVRGEVRNRLDHVMTVSDEAGRFSFYPPPDEHYTIVGLHPKVGFALTEKLQFKENRTLRLLAWSGLEVEYPEAPQASLTTQLAETDNRPELVFNQYWVDLKVEDPGGVFRFTHVPSIHQTLISRSFPGPRGASISVADVSISLSPGEQRRLNLGPMSDQQRERVDRFREKTDSRKAPNPPPDGQDNMAQPSGQAAVRRVCAAFSEPRGSQEMAGLLRLAPSAPR